MFEEAGRRPVIPEQYIVFRWNIAGQPLFPVGVQALAGHPVTVNRQGRTWKGGYHVQPQTHRFSP
jgi:hypothetical protein